MINIISTMMVFLAVGCSTLLVLSAYFTGVESHETDASMDNAKEKPVLIQHPMMRWYTPRLGKRAREIDESMFYTPRLGKRVTEDEDTPYSFWESVGGPDAKDDSEYALSREARGEKKEGKVWKLVGVFNPRLGRSVSLRTPESQVSRDNFNHIGIFNSD